MTTKLLSLSLASVVGLSTWFGTQTAYAQTTPVCANPTCPTGDSVVYMAGSTAVQGNVVAQVAITVAKANPPISVVYQGIGSCGGVNAVMNLNDTNVVKPGTALSVAPLVNNSAKQLTMFLPPNGGSLAVTSCTCTLPTVDGGTPQRAQIGVSDVFAETCNGGDFGPNGFQPPSDSYLGPVQAMTFVVPPSSGQSVISREAAYMVFGFGAKSGTVWNDPAYMFIRSSTSGTLMMLATAIGVPGVRWSGQAQSSTGAVVAAVSGGYSNGSSDGGVQNYDKTIGIMAAEDADSANGLGVTTVKELAYQHTGQTCGYTPDFHGRDKKNVRDGHYAIWGPLHIYVSRDSGAFDSVQLTNAKTVAQFMTGDQTAAGLDIIQVEAGANVIPQCAMSVQRDREMGPMSLFKPQKPCGCYFEAKANSVSSCKACSKDSDCPTNTTCSSYGYCEAS